MRIPDLKNRKWVVDDIGITNRSETFDECYYAWDTLTKEIQYRISVIPYNSDIPNIIYKKYQCIEQLTSKLIRLKSVSFFDVIRKLNVLNFLIYQDVLPFDCKKFTTPLIESVKEDIADLSAAKNDG